MPQQRQDDPGHWIYVPPTERPREPTPRSGSAAGLTLFFIGFLLLSYSLIGLRGVEVFQRLMHRYSGQIESVQ